MLACPNQPLVAEKAGPFPIVDAPACPEGTDAPQAMMFAAHRASSRRGGQ